MSESAKRSTIYVDPDLHSALLIKTLDTGRSETDLDNAAVSMAFHEDLEDIQVFDAHIEEPEITYEVLLKDFEAHWII